MISSDGGDDKLNGSVYWGSISEPLGVIFSFFHRSLIAFHEDLPDLLYYHSVILIISIYMYIIVCIYIYSYLYDLRESNQFIVYGFSIPDRKSKNQLKPQ